VTAVAETEPVNADSERDAADDPALWYNYSDPEKSLIIGSDKTNGVDVFNLDGKRLSTNMAGRVNNVDLRYNFTLQGDTFDLVGGSNRTTKTLDFWRMNSSKGELTNLASIPTELPDVYGFCMYKSPVTGSFYAFINSKTGKVEQWRISEMDSSFHAVKVRELQLASQVEGMVADDSLAQLYVGVEGEGIYRFGAEETDSAEGQFVKKSGEANPNIEYDVEGLAIYYLNESEGYLVASSQGNYSYAVFQRDGENEYIGSFEIVDGAVDGVEETDGLELFHLPLGENYPAGILICQDGYNYEGDSKHAQNFKMISWKDIAGLFSPPLKSKD
jgi:3-phytase